MNNKRKEKNKMSIKKYVSYDRLGLYDENIKDVIITKASTALALSRQYTDNKIGELSSIDTSNIYTKTEVDAALSDKSDISHNHDEKYDALGSANTSLEESKSYTDIQIASEASARNTVVSSSINTHNTSTSAHNDIRMLIDALREEIEKQKDNINEVISTTQPESQNVGECWMQPY
jgi:hypothetical protein